MKVVGTGTSTLGMVTLEVFSGLRLRGRGGRAVMLLLKPGKLLLLRRLTQQSDMSFTNEAKVGVGSALGPLVQRR